jgi:tRNA nucleotidyltransferase (CCA-adding enzyme)
MSKKIELDIPEFVSFILKRLKDAGHQAFVVGGAVRDSCLKRPTLDWDVVTSGYPSFFSKAWNSYARQLRKSF